MNPKSSKICQARACGRRGFALPMVILLALIGTLAVSMLLMSHASSHRATVRQVESYVDAHRAAGIQECILRWLDTVRGKLNESIDSDGHAFTMNVQGSAGGTVKVFFRDAQGALLTETSAVSGRRREILDDANFILQALPPQGPSPQLVDNSYQRSSDGPFDGRGVSEKLTRTAGPPEVSLYSSPDLVIRVLALAIIPDPRQAEAAALALIRARNQRELKTDGVLSALGGLDAPEQAKRELAGMFVVVPQVYECVAETRSGSGALLDRSSGLYQVDDSRNDAFKQGGAFLSWRREDLPE